MAVYERTYRPYVGPITPERGRFLVLPRYAIRAVFATKLFVAFFAICFIWPLVDAIMIYLPHNATFIKMFLQQTGAVGLGFKYDAGFFFRFFLIPQSFLAFFLTFLVGPAMISEDLRNNALPLYLARPFTKWEYLLGKSFVLIALLSLITWVPGILLFLLQGYLAGNGWLFDNLRIGAAILLSCAIYIAVLCLMSLSISAYVKWKPLARLSLLVVFFVAGGMAGVLNFVLRTHWASVLNILDMLRVVWGNLFGLPIAVSQTPLWAAWLSLLTFCSICVVVLSRKIRAYEVVRG
jgi:ABC-2 type transport system permease protein